MFQGCPYNCQKCLSRRECKQCKEGLFSVVRGGRLYCVWNCPRGYIPLEDDGKSCVRGKPKSFFIFFNKVVPKTSYYFFLKQKRSIFRMFLDTYYRTTVSDQI